MDTIRWPPWWPSWISDQNDFSYFDLIVTPIIPIKFQDNRPFVSGEAKNRFSRWPPWWPTWISHRNNFSYFYLQVTQILLTKFHVKWPLSESFQIKILIFFHTFAQNIDCGYSLELPRQGSNEHPQSMFIAEIRKIMYTPVNPSFTM